MKKKKPVNIFLLPALAQHTHTHTHVLATDFENKSATTLSSLLLKHELKTQKTVKMLKPESIFKTNKAFPLIQEIPI